jgi:hypothetical protein
MLVCQRHVLCRADLSLRHDPACTQGNVFTFLQQSGGRLPEGVVVPMILEPTMSALNYIHGLVSPKAALYRTLLAASAL